MIPKEGRTDSQKIERFEIWKKQILKALFLFGRLAKRVAMG